MIIDEINIAPLLKALNKFDEFRLNILTEQERAGAIQAFEYCFELSWKIMRRFLEKRGQVVNSPKETFRVAALEGFIDDPELWFEFLKKRTMAVHTYEEDEAEKVAATFPSFSIAIHDFLVVLGAK
ncbi:MAG: HI0074 family nucleotidyltransferase substrate-binding subunit [Alphaproteobacteria bacterium]|nr:HI0074 family nucleotidyltransferase substrate-binding subunit [Alphaproteobacteria bacterium]